MEIRKINVNATFAAFKSDVAKRKITPVRFSLKNGEHHHIDEIRRAYADRVGESLNVHFVVKTTKGRYFDILYDSKKLTWFLVIEIEDVLML